MEKKKRETFTISLDKCFKQSAMTHVEIEYKPDEIFFSFFCSLRIKPVKNLAEFFSIYLNRCSALSVLTDFTGFFRIRLAVFMFVQYLVVSLIVVI